MPSTKSRRAGWRAWSRCGGGSSACMPGARMTTPSIARSARSSSATRFRGALPEALLAGMEMDARGVRYGSDEELLRVLLSRGGDGGPDDDARDGRERGRGLSARGRPRRGHAADQHRARRRARTSGAGGCICRRRCWRASRRDERRRDDGVGVDAGVGDVRAGGDAGAPGARRSALSRRRSRRAAVAARLPLRDHVGAAHLRAIGGAIARNGYDSVSQRAYVSLPRKLAARGGVAAGALRRRRRARRRRHVRRRPARPTRRCVRSCVE